MAFADRLPIKLPRLDGSRNLLRDRLNAFWIGAVFAVAQQGLT